MRFPARTAPLLACVSAWLMGVGCGDDSPKPFPPGTGGVVSMSGASGSGAGDDAGGEMPDGAGGDGGGGAAGAWVGEGGVDAGGAPPVICNDGNGAIISGRVLSPGGQLPLAGVTVYVPSATVDPPPKGTGCFRCASAFGGVPIARAVTDAEGRFQLLRAPTGAQVPLVVQTGKWRRSLELEVVPCQDNPVAEEKTRLPGKRSEGYLPSMALVTGGEDTLECLLRKLGIDDSEFGYMPDDGRVRLYQGKGGIAKLAGAAGSELPAADKLWSDPEKLSAFDLVLLGSELDQNTAAKPQAALDAIHGYVLAGGRLLVQHFQNYFLSAGPGDVASVASYAAAANLPDPATVTVDESSARGQALSASLLAADPQSTRGALAVGSGRNSVAAVHAPALRLLYSTAPASVQAFSLDLPASGDEPACGRVVETELLTGAGDTRADFPDGCHSTGLSAQERALAYLIFDLGACLP